VSTCGSWRRCEPGATRMQPLSWLLGESAIHAVVTSGELRPQYVAS
jgi:hypothetical protein